MIGVRRVRTSQCLEVAKRVFMDDPGGQRFGLAPIELANKSDFDPAFFALAQPLSDYTFACNYIWGTSLKLYWMQSDRHLCIFANGTGDLTLLIPPIPQPTAGDADMRDCLGRCFEVMDRYNDQTANRSASRIEYVSDELLERINTATVRGPLNLGASPMSGDYIYDMPRMIDLAGGSLKSKRHARSKFLREHPDARTAPYNPIYQQACFDLLDLWHDHGDLVHPGEVNEEHVGSNLLRSKDTLASKRALLDYQPLGLTGMVLLADDRLIGMTFGETVGTSQASILIEKTHPDYDGAAQYIFSEFCRTCWSQLPLCNAGDDWGLANLRFTKQSYRPVRLLNKSVLTRSSIPLVMGYQPPASPTEHTTDVHAEIHQLAGESPSLNELEHTTVPDPVALYDAQGREVLIEPASPSDLTAICAIEAACFNSDNERFNRRQVRSLLHNPRAMNLAVRCDGRLVGWASTLIRHDRAGKVGRVYAIGVLPDMQGRHIGQRLLQHALDHLIQQQPRCIVLEVREDNLPAITLYHKLGFADQRFLTDYYGPQKHGWRMTRHTATPMPIPT